jgi:hypothetical protein
MARRYNCACGYCGRSITMTDTPVGWLPFEGGNRHFCGSQWRSWKQTLVIGVGGLLLFIVVILWVVEPR